MSEDDVDSISADEVIRIGNIGADAFGPQYRAPEAGLARSMGWGNSSVKKKRRDHSSETRSPGRISSSDKKKVDPINGDAMPNDNNTYAAGSGKIPPVIYDEKWGAASDDLDDLQEDSVNDSRVIKNKVTLFERKRMSKEYTAAPRLSPSGRNANRSRLGRSNENRSPGKSQRALRTPNMEEVDEMSLSKVHNES